MITSPAEEIRSVRQCYEDSRRAEMATVILEIDRKWKPLFRQLQDDCGKETGHDFQDLEACTICGAIKPN